MMDKERLAALLNNNHKCYGTTNLVLNSKLVKELNGIIKKLNDEVDMLIKQKEYLQGKLREKEINQLTKTTDGRELI
jgi:hypothetical protein